MHTITELRNSLLNAHGNPKKELCSLLSLFNITHDNSLSSIVHATQKAWLRPAGKERWQLHDQLSAHKENTFPLFKELGFIDQIIPEKTAYDYGIILGFFYERKIIQLKYLCHLWHNGIRFNKLILLGSDRLLDPIFESTEKILNPNPETVAIRPGWTVPLNFSLKTEMDMMKLLIDQYNLPQDLRALPTTFINTPMQKTEHGILRRANTADTIKTFISTCPKPGSCLFISMQPFVGYQDAVIRTFIPTDFEIDTIGGASSENNISVFADMLARWLYQELELRKNS